MSDLAPLFPEGLIDFEPLENSVKPVLASPYARSDFQQGMARQERIFRNGVSSFPGTWPMNDVQYEMWLGYLEATGGIYGWHTHPVCCPGGYKTMKVRIVSGSLQAPLDGNEWEVSCTLETMDYRPLDPTLTAAAMLTYGGTLSLAEVVDLVEAAMADLAEAARG